VAGDEGADRAGEESDAERRECRDLGDTRLELREEQASEDKCGGGSVDGVFVPFDDCADGA